MPNITMESTEDNRSYVPRSQLYFSLFGAYLVIEFFMPTLALFASIPSVYLEVSISLVFLCGCLVALKFVDESTIRQEPGRSEDAESTISHHPSEAAVLPDQDSQQNNTFSLLRSRNILFTLAVFILPVFAETARRAFTPYFLVNRRPGQSLQEVYLALLPGEIVRVLLFALFVPLAIPFVQKRWGVCQSAIDSWMIRGSLLLLAISCAFTTSATTVASRLIGESASEPRGYVDLFADAYRLFGLRRWLGLESFPTVIHYSPS